VHVTLQPWHFRLLVYVLTSLGAVVLWCWFRTLRLEVRNREVEDEPLRKGAVLYASWHRGIFLAAFFWRWQGGWMVASGSKDGEWAAGMIKRFGNRVLRGSSAKDGKAKGGKEVMRDAEALLAAGLRGGLTPDAPRGPERRCKPGILALAQRAGVPIIPVTFSVWPCWRMRSWDRTILPFPFARFVAQYGEPFHAGPPVEGAAFEARLRDLDEAMNRGVDALDAETGMV
jgi:lysophospholipid acyltransferase (LPLAT)-like uncharacterized protein